MLTAFIIVQSLRIMCWVSMCLLLTLVCLMPTHQYVSVRKHEHSADNTVERGFKSLECNHVTI